MNTVSPRKYDRMRSYEVAYRDLLAGTWDIWEFCDMIISQKGLMEFLRENFPSDVEGIQTNHAFPVIDNSQFLQEVWIKSLFSL